MSNVVIGLYIVLENPVIRLKYTQFLHNNEVQRTRPYPHLNNMHTF